MGCDYLSFQRVFRVLGRGLTSGFVVFVRIVTGSISSATIGGTRSPVSVAEATLFIFICETWLVSYSGVAFRAWSLAAPE